MPTITALTPSQGTGGQALTIVGTDLSAVTQVNFGQRSVTATVVSDTIVTCTIPVLCCGQVDVDVTAGGVCSNCLPFFYICPPECEAVSPKNGPAVGSTVTIFGENLLTATAVDFGTVGTAAPTVVSDTELSVVAPAHPAFTSCTDTVDITITTAAGTSCPACDCCQFTYFDFPTVTSVTPSSGPACTDITITGTCLLNVSDVTFTSVAGGTPVSAPSFTSISETALVATVPCTLAPDVYDVQVFTPGGVTAITFADQFTVV